VLGTTFLQKTEQFTRPGATLTMAAYYLAAFYLLSLALRVVPIGLAYAIWSGLGIVLISLIGWLVIRQTLDMAAAVGLGFIITGVIIVNVFSKSITH
jgi:small multidrug resistance pump